MSTYDGSPVKRVRVTAQVTFDAFVFDSEDATEHRIAHELADAIEMHAPHLRDSEVDSDALIVMTEGGSGDAVKVEDVVVKTLDEPFGNQEVLDAIGGTQGWL